MKTGDEKAIKTALGWAAHYEARRKWHSAQVRALKRTRDAFMETATSLGYKTPQKVKA